MSQFGALTIFLEIFYPTGLLKFRKRKGEICAIWLFPWFSKSFYIFILDKPLYIIKPIFRSCEKCDILMKLVIKFNVHRVWNLLSGLTWWPKWHSRWINASLHRVWTYLSTRQVYLFRFSILSKNMLQSFPTYFMSKIWVLIGVDLFFRQGFLTLRNSKSVSKTLFSFINEF